ncbi:MAG: transcription antitermination factor NusB [Acidobacteriota bacterium]
MGARRKARECALQVLFQADLNREAPDVVVFFEHHPVSRTIEEFATFLIEGWRKNAARIDQIIGRCSKNWSVERMGAVDRNVLRVAVFELLYGRTTPPKVVIDEAIEIAKKFGSSESHAFINGVLDGVHKARADLAAGSK